MESDRHDQIRVLQAALDYHIAVASECTASYDDEHHEITRRYLDRKIARFLSNAEIQEMVGADTPG